MKAGKNIQGQFTGFKQKNGFICKKGWTCSMRKKAICAVLAAILTISLMTGCGTNVQNETQDVKDTTISPTETVQESTVASGDLVAIGDTIVIPDVMELTINYVFVIEAVNLAREKNSLLTYGLSDKEGEKYFVVSGTVKNLAGTALDVTGAIREYVNINDKYKSRLMVTTGNISNETVKSLQSKPFSAYYSLSDEVVEIMDTITIELSLLNEEKYASYSMIAMTGDFPCNKYSIKITKNDLENDPELVQ